MRLIQMNEPFSFNNKSLSDCHYMGGIIGPEGHIYSYLFTSNKGLAQGAINDLYHNAYEKGANVAYVTGEINFTTSVTFFARAYNCVLDDLSR